MFLGFIYLIELQFRIFICWDSFALFSDAHD
jgi:hypothetical protein